MPETLKPTQLPAYLSAAAMTATFHGLRLRYQTDAAHLYVPQPRVWAFPALIFHRNDDAFLVVTDVKGILLENGEHLAAHLQAIQAAAAALVEACSSQLGIALTPAAVETFPGFRLADGEVALGDGRKFVNGLGRGDEWLLVTGDKSHYLSLTADIACAFHMWRDCGADAKGASAVVSPSVVAPRVFFLDGEQQHCAHAGQFDHREERCHLHQIDERPCCHACVYERVCWPRGHGRALPCGGGAIPLNPPPYPFLKNP